MEVGGLLPAYLPGSPVGQGHLFATELGLPSTFEANVHHPGALHPLQEIGPLNG
jgi:hypothetical protein